MSVKLNEAGLIRFFNSTAGPVGRLLADRADRVRERAAQNASGEILGIDTGDLLAGLRAQLEHDGQTLVGKVYTTAQHRGFNYPAYWDRNGKPWLTSALRDALS